MNVNISSYPHIVGNSSVIATSSSPRSILICEEFLVSLKTVISLTVKHLPVV